jgi:hypothetical protein
VAGVYGGYCARPRSKVGNWAPDFEAARNCEVMVTLLHAIYGMFRSQQAYDGTRVYLPRPVVAQKTA